MKEYPQPSKNDSHRLVWERRFSLFSHACQVLVGLKKRVDSHIPNPTARLEDLLGRSMTARLRENELRQTRNLRTINSSADARRFEEWDGEQKKDRLAVSIGIGLCSFALCRFGVLPAIERAVMMRLKLKASLPILIQKGLNFGYFATAAVLGASMGQRVYLGLVMDLSLPTLRGYVELPLSEGRSAFHDEHCRREIEAYRDLWNGMQNRHVREALNNPSTADMIFMRARITNCMRRFHLQERLRRERGIAPDSLLLPVRIPPPGVPKMGKMVDGELVDLEIEEEVWNTDGL